VKKRMYYGCKKIPNLMANREMYRKFGNDKSQCFESEKKSPGQSGKLAISREGSYSVGMRERNNHLWPYSYILSTWPS
jgi:hypothetical protein